MELKKRNQNYFPVLDQHYIELLHNLSIASGTAGSEGEVRTIVNREISPYVDQISTDNLGNMIAVRSGKGVKPIRVMITAHMDEIGFMITFYDGNGIFQFTPVGDLDIRHIPGKSVWIGSNHIPGVIGARPFHLTLFKPEEREEPIPINILRIDTGLGEEPSKKIKPGDRVVFGTNFIKTDYSFMGKALDNRVGVTSLIALIKETFENIDFYTVFASQGELGGRGVQVATNAINPDIAIVVDCLPAYDFPNADNSKNMAISCQLGKGPIISIGDTNTLFNPHLIQFAIEMAEKSEIPYQLSVFPQYSTEVGVIQRQYGGIPCLLLGIPCRSPRTAISVIRRNDWDNLLRLLYATLINLSSKNIGVI